MNRNGKAKSMIVRCFMVAAILLITVGSTQADTVFGTPQNLGPIINSPHSEAGAHFSADGLALCFERAADGLWTTRATKADSWNVPTRYWPLEASDFASVTAWPGSTTADGLEMYGWGSEPGGQGGIDIIMCTRKTTADNWGPPVNLGAVVNSSADEISPTIRADGLELFFSGYWTNARPDGYGNADLWVTTRATRNDPWGTPVNLGSIVNSAYQDARPFLSADGLVLLFDSQRPGGYGRGDLYMTRRATLSSPWEEPVNLGPAVNSIGFEIYPCISADGSTLIFDSDRPCGYGGQDVWQAPIEPVVDLNHDGRVDEDDKAILMAHIGENYPAADISPMPWGDGKVDANDLAVLMSHWGPSPDDSALTARWRLDETDGKIARDSMGENHATVHGEAVWTAAGRLNGALQLDGVSSYVSTPCVLDPAQGTFKVSAWVKGVVPGQVILSQDTGTDWLWTLPPMGWLATSLSSDKGGLLICQTGVTDDNWREIALSWDGYNRILYVDGIEKARDTQAGLVSSMGGLQVGAMAERVPGFFWSGLIDDVRVVSLTPPEQPPATRDTAGFDIYAEPPGTGDVIDCNWMSQGTLEFHSQTTPAGGNYCIHCTGAAQYDSILFDFWPDKDLTQLVAQGYFLEFWVRGDSPGMTFDVWFKDTETGEPGDRAWRQGQTINETWNGAWKCVRIPLRNLASKGSYDADDGTWVGPQEGKFKWAEVDCFQVAFQSGSLTGKHFWFDSIRVTK